MADGRPGRPKRIRSETKDDPALTSKELLEKIDSAGELEETDSKDAESELEEEEVSEAKVEEKKIDVSPEERDILVGKSMYPKTQADEPVELEASEEVKAKAIEFIESDHGRELLRRGNSTRTLLAKSFHAAGMNISASEFGTKLSQVLAKNVAANKKQNIVELIKAW